VKLSGKRDEVHRSSSSCAFRGIRPPKPEYPATPV
jgi:hypothetical protein